MAFWSAPITRARPSRPRLSVQPLEGRNLLTAAGGGFTAGGLLGEYFDNPDLDGTPAFVRRDVRIDFDWQDRAPGGSTSPDYRRVGSDDFSVRWTGQVIPRFSEWYTFNLTAEDGARLWVRPAGELFTWNLLIDTWDEPAADPATARYWMAGNRPYDIRVEYRELKGPATARLAWSSPSTPAAVIDPATNLGVNAVTYDFYLYADATKTGRPEWGDPVDYFGRPKVAMDELGWPTADAGKLFWDNRDPAKTGGTYLLRFTGLAEVSGWMGRGRFVVDGINYGQTLPATVGYDPETNTTTAKLLLDGTDTFGLNFVQTRRAADSPEGTGVTDVQLMRPTAASANAAYQPGELFDAHIKQAFSRFTTLRYLTANFNAEKEWADRKLPGHMQGAWWDKAAVWEHEVMLANETGKDLYITVPVLASPDYIRNLANLIRYGSDGVMPYREYVADPVFPGLNPNLRVYVEWGNEIWNWSFAQGGWAADLGRAAVLDGTPDGLIVNFDGERPGGDFRRWMALRTVETSTIFREVWGDPAMGDRVRVLLEYQYDNQQLTATESLKFIDEYFNNGDGGQHVADPHPVSYYVWGAGGAAYFGASNTRGLVSNVVIPGGTFEGLRVPTPGKAERAPIGTSWTFDGDAGLYRDAAGAAPNAPIDVPGVGRVPATPYGSQALYVSGQGSAWVSIAFPKAGTYAIDFRAAGELGPDMGNPLDFYLGDQRVTPNGGNPAPPPYPWWPGNGNRDSARFANYGTVPIKVTAAGRYTFKIVGRGAADRTTVIDDLRVASLDAIFAGRIPAGARSAGEESRLDYQDYQATQARYAQTYGLNVVSYESGWSLGGDREAMPIHAWAKYLDPRAAPVIAKAVADFQRAGGEMYVMGTFDQWHLDDAENADLYPLVQGIDATMATLPPLPVSKVVIRGSAPVTLRTATGLRALNPAGFAAPGDWVTWTVQIPTTGYYRITPRTDLDGPVAVSVDGVEVGEGPTGSGAAADVLLTAGMHTIRVQSAGGWFTLQGVTLDRLDTPPAL